MIAVKALFGKLNSSPFSDELALIDALRKVNLVRMVCPACGAKGRCSGIGAYSRMLITVSDGKRREKSVDIPRVICQSCHHTHALLPDVLIPYGSYTLRFILHVLELYQTRTEPVAKLCESWAISVSTLYSWIHSFLDQHNLWFRAIEHILWITRAAFERIRATDEFPSIFRERFRFSFLQGKSATHSHLAHGRGEIVFQLPT